MTFRLGCPKLDHFLQALRLGLRLVVALGEVRVEVIKLPAISLE